MEDAPFSTFRARDSDHVGEVVLRWMMEKLDVCGFLLSSRKPPFGVLRTESLGSLFLNLAKKPAGTLFWEVSGLLECC